MPARPLGLLVGTVPAVYTAWTEGRPQKRAVIMRIHWLPAACSLLTEAGERQLPEVVL